MKILVTPTSLCKNKEIIADLSEKAEIILNTTGKPLTEEQLFPLVADIDGYLAGLDDITGRVLMAAPKLRAVSRYGVGYERVDIKTAKELGIKVTNTPGANTQSVADLAMGLILSAARQIPYLNGRLKEGNWDRANGREIYGKTIGIIGLGAIGKSLAKRAMGFSMKVLAYDPYIDRKWAEENGVSVCEIEDLVKGSDVISLHVPLTEGTRNIISRERIGMMRDGVIIVNTSRGGLIDLDAAADYIESGKIYGMGFDAFEKEPPEKHRIYEFPNVIMTPHAGAHTAEAVAGMTEMSISNLFSLLENDGRAEKYVVNK
ncbi:MAG: phosphoglycerate dehydrogenase [Clostridia bacterium]|nr:phosphoglycerate dehydrogenase [Clostridia bacterium]MBR5768442.1 phosphoglycerate dehydrogenase [Clostridia bacterium]